MSFQENDFQAAASDTSAPPPDPGEHATRLANELRGLVHDHLELVTLETRLCIHNVLKMTVIAAVSALVLAGAWFALTGTAVLALIGAGVTPVTAMALLALAHTLLALGGWLLFRHTSVRLGWPATQRTLGPVSVLA